MRKTLIILPFLSLACFDAGTAPLNCSADAPACPDGLVCFNGRCVGTEDDLAALADMSTVDLVGDIGGASQCAKGGGTRIGNRGAWLCPGVYGGANPKASAACIGKICSDLSLFTAQECKAVTSGFFAATWGSTQSKLDPQFETCNSKTYSIALFGCGLGDFETKVGCGGFVMNMQATPANKLLAVSPVMLDTFVNSEPANGVICCP